MRAFEVAGTPVARRRVREIRPPYAGVRPPSPAWACTSAAVIERCGDPALTRVAAYVTGAPAPAAHVLNEFLARTRERTSHRTGALSAGYREYFRI